MNTITKIEAKEPAIQSEVGAVISMIERAARDPAVDIAKLQQLMEMRERIEDKASEKAFDLAMTQAQSEMRAVAVDSNNPQTRSKYASYFALDRAVRPVYTKHGFSLSFDTGEASESSVRVMCRVAHNEGHARTYHIDMPADGKGAKGGDVMTKTHATGAAVAYGTRYLLKMIFNIAVGADDDGNGASASGLSANSKSRQSARSSLKAAPTSTASALTQKSSASKISRPSISMRPSRF